MTHPMWGSTIMCAAAFGIALAGPPDPPVPLGTRSPPGPWHELVTEWSGIGARLANRLPGASLLANLSVYHARTRPFAEARFWVPRASDFWLTANNPICHGLLNSPRDLWIADFRALSHRPVPGEESSPFGYRWHPILKRRKLHKGLDFKGKRGTPVQAAGPGRVTFAGRRGSYGNVVMIAHGLGLETRYAHLQRIRTKTDRLVVAGEEIGTIGSTGRSTGPHLHFEVRQFGEPLDPRWALGIERPSLSDRLSTLWHFFAAD